MFYIFGPSAQAPFGKGSGHETLYGNTKFSSLAEAADGSWSYRMYHIYLKSNQLFNTQFRYHLNQVLHIDLQSENRGQRSLPSKDRPSLSGKESLGSLQGCGNIQLQQWLVTAVT